MVDPVLRLRRLSERAEAEEQLRVAEARGCSVSERLEQALELSDVARDLGCSVGAAWVTAPAADLADKSRRYPLGR